MSVAASPPTVAGGILSFFRERVPAGKADLSMDLLAFTGTVLVATLYRWEARDVIWGLWISSLAVGYSTIVSTVVRGVRSVEGGFRTLAVLGGLGSLAFFTVHFGMFHLVHGVFLNGFFPLIGDGQGFPDFPAMVGRSLALFWPLVVASFLSRLPDIFPGPGALAGKDAFAAPYGNVVRMHLLIFVFAGLHIAGLSRLAIVPVLAAYFFPWKAVAARLRR